MAQRLHLLELVGDEDHDQALGGEPPEYCKQLDTLRLGDPGGWLVEDKDARPTPQESRHLQLLALTNGEGPSLGVGVEIESVPRCGLGEGTPPRLAIQDRSARRTKKKVVEHRKGEKDEGVLVEHSDTRVECSSWRRPGERFPIQLDRAGIGGEESREDLHQRGLTRAILAEEAMQLP